MNFVAAIAFYLLYIAVLLILVVIPGIEWKLSTLDIVMKSALFGFGAYMTYELTSMSVIKWWNWNMVMIDTLWWTALTAIIGIVMYLVYKVFI